ncbi:MAG: GHKL domain-containing protein [Polyangiaceae bacterium]|nr:GHKL domain-containing protein [Polyangiaceae bacterium]
MTRLIVSATAAIGLILFVAFIVARLIRSRSQGISIRMQMFLAIATIVGAFAFGLGLLVVDRIEARATLLAESAASDQAAAIATLLGNEMATRETKLETLAHNLGASRAPGTPEVHLAVLSPTKEVLFIEGPKPDDPGYMFQTAPIVVRGETVGFVRVGKPTLKIRQVLKDVAPAVLVSSIVLGMAAALAAMLIGRAIAGPIEALSEFAVRVAEGEKHAVPPPAAGREVLRLSRSIDSMRRQIEGRPFVETFAADLSHELKNPVAAIRASAEVLADGALEEKEEAKRFVGRIQEATTRIEALLGDLLSLARIEARGVETAARVNVVDIVRELAARDRDGASVQTNLPLIADVRGDAAWLTRAVDNLIDNAVRHGTAGQPITIEVKREGGSVHIQVRNAGTVDKNVAKRLFRRFVTTREGKGGTGLGLAIVRAIAEAHSGSATLVSGGPPEVVFQIELPEA